MAEYIIIVLVVAIVVIFALRYFGGSVFGKFKNATHVIETAQNPGDAVDASAGSGGGQPFDPKESGSSGTKRESPSQRPEKQGSSSPSNASPGIDGQVESLRKGVGDSNEGPIDEIRIDTSTLTFLAAIVIGIALAVVALNMRNKTKREEKKKKKKVKLVKGEEGQAMVEFVLSAITFFFVILGVMQLAMALNAYSLVRYAAYNAARAAIVHGGDQDKMEEAARLSLLATFPSHGRADTPKGLAENYMGAKATDKNPAMTFFFEPITKVELIRRNGADGVVTFDDPKDTPKSIITVKVTHLYELVIPLVNRIIFRVFMLIKQGPGYTGQTVNFLSGETDQMRRGGVFADKEFRIPLVGVYTMRMQSDLQ